MKKPILFFSGAIIILIVISLVLTFSQVGLFLVGNQTGTGFYGVGGGAVESSLKMATADRAIVAPQSAPSVATPLPRKITKAGSLSILVETAETATKNIQAIAESASGYVSDSNLHEVTPGVKAGSITIRVPADKFDQTISRIKELALKVENENINANDVTDQFIDIEARLKNLKAEETQYLSILKKAQKIDDIVNVTNQLNQVRQQIDSWQGQLKYLNSQVDLSTITVNLTAEKEAQIFGLNWRPFTIIKQAVRSLLTGLVSYVNVIIAIVIFLPVVALWVGTFLLIVWLVWLVAKWLKKSVKIKKKPKKPTI